MDKNEIIGLIYEWQGLISKRGGIERYIEPALLSAMASKPIKIITGFRRAGKSFLAQRIAKKLVEKGDYQLDNILYLNFEDYRLVDVNTAKKLGDVYSVFLSDVAKKGRKLVLLDEIQNVTGWDKFVRTMYEKDDETKIILTGSNSELLSAEIGSNLAGRYIEFSIFPFSFKEFLEYSNVRIKTESDYFKHKPDIEKAFAEYINFGGLPETFEINSEEAKYSYLKGIITKVVLDDIVKRFGVDNVDVLERLLNYMLSNVGNTIAYTGLKNKIKTLGFEMKVETIIKYTSYFIKSFVILELNKFDWKQRRIFSASKKFFAIDTGLTSLYRPGRENFTMKLENLVFLNAKRRRPKIYYGVNERGREIDFILDVENGFFDKYQVCADLEEQNCARELGAFLLVDKYLKNGQNLILTLNNSISADILKKHNAVHANVIRWLLEV